MEHRNLAETSVSVSAEKRTTYDYPPSVVRKASRLEESPQEVTYLVGLAPLIGTLEGFPIAARRDAQHSTTWQVLDWSQDDVLTIFIRHPEKPASLFATGKR